MWSHGRKRQIKRRDGRKEQWNQSTITLENIYDWPTQWCKSRDYQLEDRKLKIEEWSQHREVDQWEDNEFTRKHELVG